MLWVMKHHQPAAPIADAAAVDASVSGGSSDVLPPGVHMRIDGICGISFTGYCALKSG